MPDPTTNLEVACFDVLEFIDSEQTDPLVRRVASRYEDCLAFAKDNDEKLKVVVAIQGEELFIAIGFFANEHDQIASTSFSEKLGADWKQLVDEYGGGDLEIDFTSNSAVISGSSSSLGDRPVPKRAEAGVVQQIRMRLNA